MNSKTEMITIRLFVFIFISISFSVKYYVDEVSGSGSTCNSVNPCKIDIALGKPDVTQIHFTGTQLQGLIAEEPYGLIDSNILFTSDDDIQITSQTPNCLFFNFDCVPAETRNVTFAGVNFYETFGNCSGFNGTGLITTSSGCTMKFDVSFINVKITNSDWFKVFEEQKMGGSVISAFRGFGMEITDSELIVQSSEWDGQKLVDIRNSVFNKINYDATNEEQYYDPMNPPEMVQMKTKTGFRIFAESEFLEVNLDDIHFNGCGFEIENNYEEYGNTQIDVSNCLFENFLHESTMNSIKANNELIVNLLDSLFVNNTREVYGYGMQYIEENSVVLSIDQVKFFDPMGPPPTDIFTDIDIFVRNCEFSYNYLVAATEDELYSGGEETNYDDTDDTNDPIIEENQYQGINGRFHFPSGIYIWATKNLDLVVEDSVFRTDFVDGIKFVQDTCINGIFMKIVGKFPGELDVQFSNTEFYSKYNSWVNNLDGEGAMICLEEIEDWSYYRGHWISKSASLKFDDVKIYAEDGDVFDKNYENSAGWFKIKVGGNINVTVTDSLFETTFYYGSVIDCWDQYTKINILVENSVFRGLVEPNLAFKEFSEDKFPEDMNNLQFSEAIGSAFFINPSNADLKIRFRNSNFSQFLSQDTGGVVKIRYDGNSPNSVSLILDHCFFEGNMARNKGGVVSMRDAMMFTEFNVSNCVFNNNFAQSGGCFETTGGELFVENSVFSNNSVNNDGGCIYSTNTRVHIHDSHFNSNRGRLNGGKNLFF